MRVSERLGDETTGGEGIAMMMLSQGAADEGSEKNLGNAAHCYGERRAVLKNEEMLPLRALHGTKRHIRKRPEVHKAGFPQRPCV